MSTIKQDEEALAQWAAALGYEPCCIKAGVVYGVCPMAYTYGLCVGVGAYGYAYRYCYERKIDAVIAMKAWAGDGHGDPPGPWIKLKGHQSGERLGPGALL